MRRTPLVLRKPTVREILRGITPFVIDQDHERNFQRLLDERRSLAQEIVRLAKNAELTAERFRTLVRKSEQTVNVIISLLGLSQEEFFRYVTLIRVQREPNVLETRGFTEWKMPSIVRRIKQDPAFAHSIFHLLFRGTKDRRLHKIVPPFLRHKLDGRRLAQIGDGGIDALIRTGLKGSYDARKGKPVVQKVTSVLEAARVRYESGEITVPGLSRKLDVVVPHNREPHVLIEVGIFATTARELSEKALVEQHLAREAKRHYPQAVTVRVLDGIGWLARGGRALANVIEASDYIFTQATLDRLKKVVRAHVPRRFFDS